MQLMQCKKKHFLFSGKSTWSYNYESNIGLWIKQLGRGSGCGHYLVFLGKTIYSYSYFLHPGLEWMSEKFRAAMQKTKE